MHAEFHIVYVWKRLQIIIHVYCVSPSICMDAASYGLCMKHTASCSIYTCFHLHIYIRHIADIYYAQYRRYISISISISIYPYIHLLIYIYIYLHIYLHHIADIHASIFINVLYEEARNILIQHVCDIWCMKEHIILYSL